MLAHLRYLSYVLRHKWYVFAECCKLGIPFRGVVHDLSKLNPLEWFPYVDFFHGGPYPSLKDVHGDMRNRISKYKETVKRDFDAAWNRHQKRNPHHWQYWILSKDDGGTKVLYMPWRYMLEMLADWKGAGRAQGKPDTLTWYRANREKMTLHPDTRLQIEELLNYKEDSL